MHSEIDAESPQTNSRKNWFTRNWTWFVPVGCVFSTVGCCGVGLVLAILFGAPAVLKSTDVYHEAIAIAKDNDAVQKALGVPIEERFRVSGTVSFGGGGGRANLAIPIAGPNGRGTLFVLAQRNAGIWTFSTLEVIVEGGARIDLLAKK